MQEILAALVVFSAISYLAHRLYKGLFDKKSSCDVNCGCDSTSSSPVLDQIKKIS